ncbi:MAG: ABC transporter permease [Anaerolineales bacterium]|nr:ABC transporter permease [Anaerolineales bacterium]
MVSTINRAEHRILILLIRKSGEALLTAWTAVTLTFFALRATTSDPTVNLLAQGLASPEQVARLNASLFLDQPLLTQYGHFLLGLLNGDLGISFYTHRSVTLTLAEQLRPTLELGALSVLFLLVFAALLGITAAWQHNKPAGRAASWLADMLTTLPVALVGLLFLYLFASIRQHYGTGSSVFYTLALPAFVLGLSMSGAVARILKSSLLDVLQEPYILAARARGLRKNGRLLWFALRPALPPAVSLSALEIAYLFSGTVVTENIFSRPGLGRLLVSSILQGDFPVAQGVITLAALFYTLTHFFAQTLSLLIDPRLRGIQ